jgi:omega-hydroxy-beta-dihydromenaquinone-9 sulfotransferase
MNSKCIFIIGAPRSGTSILYDSLSAHPGFSYITDKHNSEHWEELLKYRHEDLKYLIKLNYNQKLVAPKFINPDHPNEGTAVWLRYLPHFEYMTENDVTPEMEQFFKQTIGKIQGSKVFINKNVHHSYRVRLLDRLFPDCKFIHLLRDRRAIAYSEVARGRDPRRALGQLYQPDRSYMYNLGLFWKEIVSRAREARQYGDNRYCEVGYESLVADPVVTLRELIDFCEMEQSAEFEGRIPKIEDMNTKWQAHLKDQDIKDLQEAIGSIDLASS